MNEFAAAVADGWKRPLTELEVEALRVHPHIALEQHDLGQFGDERCPKCAEILSYVRKLIAAIQPLIEAGERLRLAEEGSLHPAGSEHRLQFILRWHWPDGKALDWGADDLDHIRALLDEPPLTDAPPDRFEVIMREHWAGPWQVVPMEEINDG